MGELIWNVPSVPIPTGKAIADTTGLSQVPSPVKNDDLNEMSALDNYDIAVPQEQTERPQVQAVHFVFTLKSAPVSD